MKSIIVREQKIDWLKIIDLVFKRRDWGKKYCIYTAGNTTINCMLREFNFEDSTAWFRLECVYYNENGINTKYELVRYVTNHFSTDDFRMHLNKKLLNFLNSILEEETLKMAEDKYYELKHYSFCINDKEIIKAGLRDSLSKINALDEPILIEKCKDSLKEEAAKILNKEFNTKVKIYIREHPFKNESIKSLIEKIKEEI